ncbi:MAG: DNA mismatch repair protein MutS [Bacteroidetes bacterium]|nr:MAG: DNA mismatch repair protein MutS [Bacteroidota bacterium]
MSTRVDNDIMLHFDEQVAADLEFDIVREMLSKKALQPSAQARSKELVPLKNRRRIIKSLQETEELRRLICEGDSFPALEFEELHDELRMLEIRDSVLLEASFSKISRASHTMNNIIKTLKGQEDQVPRLVFIQKEIEFTKELIDPIAKVFDDKGQISDNASPTLTKIRDEMTGLRRKVSRNFNRVMKDLQEKGMLADIREGFVNNRRALAVESTYKRRVNGNVLGSSNTGTITFIEPGVVIPLNHELEILRDDERKEKRRILKELTRVARRNLPLLNRYQNALVEYDFIQARTKLAIEFNAFLPGLPKKTGLLLIKAFHPLLVRTNEGLGIETHPQNINLSSEGRLLVISGPNAGGKSLTLKTVGLLQIMLQSGLLIPASPTSEVGFFDSILTDIGDNQSIENQLSTYSYRLGRMRHFLKVSNSQSLLLLDEFGTGSDPELGGALAEVFFEELYERGVFGVITTHYANIKSRAAELENAVNASMLFDRDTLAPLFKLEIGQPGSSFTFEVAENNGISHDIIKRAKSKLDIRKVELDAIIGDLQKDKAKLAKLTNRQLRAEVEAEKSIIEARKVKSRFSEKTEALNKSTETHNQDIARGRKLGQFINRYKPGNKNKELLEEVNKYFALETSRIEDAKKRDASKSSKLKNSSISSSKRRPNHRSDEIKKGSLVRLRTGKERGEVIAMQGKTATVVFGSFKTRVQVDKLTFLR